MNSHGYLAIISVIGSVLAVVSLLNPWVSGFTGLDIVGGSLDSGFQQYIPAIIVVISMIALVLSAYYVWRIVWFFPFITFFLGVAVMALTSIFSMWEVGGVKVMQNADIGFWLSYAAGALILLGAGLAYMNLVRKVKENMQ